MIDMKLMNKIREYVPLGAIIIFVLTLISGAVLIIEQYWVGLADFVNDVLSRPVRTVMAWLTGWIPFSLAEILLISVPIWVGILIFIAVKRSKRGVKATTRYISILLSIICVIFMTFVWTYSSGYYNTKLDEKLGFSKVEIGKNQLYETSLWLCDNLNRLSDDISYGENNASYTEKSYDELSKEIYFAYSRVEEKYGIIHNFPSRIKPIMLSKPMTYTHISGVYSFMTGEANLNVNYPDFVTVSSLAHEFAHQRGIAREEEANFMAFLVCISSDDPFVQYSGYLDVFLTVSYALYEEDVDLYVDVIEKLDDRVWKDRISYSDFFDEYRDSTASDVADSVNDKFLQANGQENGTKSYGMVTYLCVDYYYDRIKG